MQAARRHDGLTRLRFIFISWVVLYHLNLPLHVTADLAWLGPVLLHGYLGVDGFFLLSGFALWLGYGERPPCGADGIGRFLLRRVAKIWPLHLAALLALALLIGLLALAGVTIRDPRRFSAGEFLLQVLLVNAWETTDQFTWNYPSWALSAEWAGYLVFPAVLAAVLRLPLRAVMLLPAGCFLGLLWLSGQGLPGSLNHSVHLGLVRFGFEFLAGLSLGRLAAAGRVPHRLALGAVAGLPLGLWLGTDLLSVLGLAGLLLTVWQQGLLRPEAAAPAPRPDLVLRLGEASFGIYLGWVFIEAILVGVLRLGEPGLAGRCALLLAGYGATLALGWCAWRWVEVPAHRWILHRLDGVLSVRLARAPRDQGRLAHRQAHGTRATVPKA